ncbi:MAG: hypothetical protein EPGJADBJ_01739 [Saprospiraceae bacterium]|nr:hypothetical protein [Saprospiraceae bacterium]
MPEMLWKYVLKPCLFLLSGGWHLCPVNTIEANDLPKKTGPKKPNFINRLIYLP